LAARSLITRSIIRANSEGSIDPDEGEKGKIEVDRDIRGNRMTSLQALETQLLALEPAQQVAIIRLLSQNLATTWEGICKTPGVMGGEACIRQTRIPVWLLASYRRLGSSDRELLDNYPELTHTDLANAWAYSDMYPAEIAAAIDRQDEE
jgi:uncharacterized protein (DUF433 family)